MTDTRKRWQDGVNILLGIWLFISPWALRFFHDMERGSWNFFIIGIAVVVFAAIALYMHAVWEEWVTLVLGIWMIISPWVIGFTANRAATRDAVIIGIAVAVLAAWSMAIRSSSGGDRTAGVH